MSRDRNGKGNSPCNYTADEECDAANSADHNAAYCCRWRGVVRVSMCT